MLWSLVSSCWEGLTRGLPSRPSGLALAPSLLQLIEQVFVFFSSVEKKAPNWDKGPLTLGRAEPFAAFPEHRARRARWVEHSADPVPSKMVFADTILIAVFDLACGNADVSLLLGSCPGFGTPAKEHPPRKGVQSIF